MRSATRASVAWSSVHLPDDVLVASMRRLAGLAVFGGLVEVVAWLAWFLIEPEVLAPPGRFPMGHVAAAAVLASSVAVVLAVRSKKVPRLQLLDWGLVYLVVMSLAVSLQEFTDPALMEKVPTGISWVVWVISIYPLLVPNTPRKMLLATLLAATMGPLSIVLVVWVNGNAMPTAGHMVLLFFPNYLAAGWAVFASRIIHHLGTAARRAQRMGAYRLTERIGHGGMGEVWKASHRYLARPAAVKLIRPESLGGLSGGDGQELHTRFEREAQTTSRLHSPHTVQIYDFGVSQDGVFYYVMELLDGLDLETLVERHGPQPAERVIHLMVQACHSLHEAHLGGLIHRDVKPANIYLCRYGTDVDFVKVLDFGLVKRWQTSGGTHPSLTQEGLMVGTPAYAAPEMLLTPDRIDARIDLYSLACCAYWLLTGSLVFEGDSALAVAVQHSRERPDPPSSRTELHIPAGLDDLILECLAKDPDSRPSSAAELMDRLRKIELVEAWDTARMERWWASHHPPMVGTAD
jgi:serine/threonine-protein kinase